MEIDRSWHLSRLSTLLRASPVVAILGARQVGKTPLARAFARKQSGRTVVFDLENETDVSRLSDPMLALEPRS